MVHRITSPSSTGRGLWLIVLVLFTSPVFAQGKQVSVPDNGKFTLIRNKIDALINEREIPSTAVSGAKDGDIIWEQAFGWTDVENREAATPYSMYPVGSLSKSKMATGVKALIEKERIRLYDSIDEFLSPVDVQTFQEAEETKVLINLRLREDSLNGYTSAPFRSDLGSFTVPVYVELERR